MKQTKSHQCKCHLKSESAFINSTATKCSAVSYISSCFVRMTASTVITIVCRDLLINKLQLLSWQSAEHKALLAVGKPQQKLFIHHVSITRSLPVHPWCCSTWLLAPQLCHQGWVNIFHSCTGLVVPGASFQVFYVPCQGWPWQNTRCWWAGAASAAAQHLLRVWVTHQRRQLCLLKEHFMRRLEKPSFDNISYLITKSSRILHGV